jgi:tetratricopeptide (TPR) repeat protein
VAIDPTFADAYVRLAFVYLTTGQMNAWRAILRKATEHADRLSERVRLGLKLVTATDNGNFAEAGQLVDEMLAKYPDLDIAYVIAEILYRPQFGPLSNGEKLLAIHRQGTIALSASTMVRNSYGYSLLDAGRYADAIREFEAYARLAPREPNPYDSLGEAYLIMGYPEKAIENYSRALAIDPTFLGAHNGRALSLATLGRYDEAIAEDPPLPHFKALLLSRVGRYREADKTIAAGLLQAESRENPAETAALSLWSAALAIDRKQQVRALEATQSAAKSIAQFHSPQQRPLLMAVDLFAGAAEVGRGRLDEARSHLESLGRTYQPAAPGENWWHSALAGEIALAAGDLQNAGAMFSASEPSMKLFRVGWRPASTLANAGLFRDGLARVAIARGDLTGAIQIYRQLLKYGPDQKWVDVFEPRYVLEIARLLERTGDTRAARQEYDRFLTFWKGADQDLPELAEARRAVARIGPLDRTGP